jgi:hypothetical protein
VNLENQAGIVASSQPPANIEEVPPVDRPVGSQFVWIPGYWGWDTDRNGYIWVSGCWRAAPPGMYWVPGYWAPIPGGWQWVAGFWTPASNKEIEYLPAPPPLADVEPVGVAPSPDRIWVPPCWYWYQGQYVRRSGYWVIAQADWVWVPSHYLWTPRGYVFCAGHWDYSLSRRGVLFAPVYFPRHIYERRGFSYSLSIVVDVGNLEFGLFTNPRYSHYYFGDYYDDTYISIGIFPWFECERRHTWYDPIFVHDRWRHFRTEPRWEEHERQEYDRRRADRDLRPPRTYREMESRAAKMPETQRRSFEIARPMNEVVTKKTTTMKFEQIKTNERQQILKQSTDVHKFGEDRGKWESQGPGAKKGQPAVERVPMGERRETAAPAERKGPEAQPTERKDVAPVPAERKGPPPQVERKGPEAQPSERKEAAPAPAERKGPPPQVERKGPEAQPSERKEPAPAPAERKGPPQQKPPAVSPPEQGQNQPDKVKVPTPPVSGKQGGGIFRKGPPSQPAEEQKPPEKDTRKGQDAQKGGDSQRGNDARKDSDAGKDRGERGKK